MNMSLHILLLMNMTKDQISWVSSHDLYWENKMYKRKRSVELDNNSENFVRLTAASFQLQDKLYRINRSVVKHARTLAGKVNRVPVTQSSYKPKTC